jgi:hypothetical protein|tara:strand:- start:623 stop:913 length:291 start_codon:yes stop_codon:yes gene_type:complete
MTKKDKNVIYTCEDCGVETYLTIKSQEDEFTKSVYVWFEIGGVVEKMWVRIGKGDQKKGWGYLDNKPTLIPSLKYNDIIRYKTDEFGITKGVIRTN